MSRYAPTLMELAPRDMVSRAIYLEVKAGRALVPRADYVLLDVRHLGRKVIEEKLPDITDFARVYLGVEPLTEPVPTQPTAHYAMGGVPTDLQTRVIRDERNTVVEGLYRRRRGRLRLASTARTASGTNSLVDLLVFGRRAGRAMAAYCAATEHAGGRRRRRGAGPRGDRGAPRPTRRARARSRSGRSWRRS